MKARLIARNIIKCKRCGDVIESKDRYDFKYCSCGKCAVDGGTDYLRRCGNLDDWEDLSEYKEVEVEPKYQQGDLVVFDYFGKIKTGIIQAVDTYPNSLIVEYDILVESEPCLYKHSLEKQIIHKE